MKPRIIRPAVAALCALAGALLFAACKENTIIRGNQNIDPNALTPSMVITDIDTRTIHDDSIVTSGMSSPIYHALGRMTPASADPYSGEVYASIFLQFLPPTTGWKIPAGYVLDSFVAVLPYAGFTWGDTNSFVSPYRYNAYAIDPAATFTMDNVHFAFDSLASGNNALPVGAGIIKRYDSLKDSVVVGGKKKAPHLRIRLGETIRPALNEAIADDNSYTSFLSHFKGLRIAPDNAGSVLPYFRLDGTTTVAYSSASLQVYGHETSTNRDTAFTFPFNPTYAGHFNRVRRDTTNMAGNLYGAELAASRTVRSRPRMFLHNEPGGAMDVTIKGIQSIPQGIINRAELIITLDESVPGILQFAPPQRIFPLGIDSATGGQYFILDRYPLNQPEPLIFIDGTLHAEANGTRAYHLNIPREIQRVRAAGGDQLRLKITGLQSFPGAYRLVAWGNDPTSANRIRLNIVYTRQLQ